jgi:2,3-bisphosphoglycerate-dependent phosphoglycerate mutase
MSNATRILFIRHGQSQGNAENRFGGHSATPLSEYGRHQAQLTAQVLASENIKAIYSSDLIRAIKTAEPLAQILGLEIQQTKAFRERNVGVMEGLAFEEAAAQYPEDYAALLRRDFDYVLSGGESYRQMLDRSSRELDLVIERHRGETVAIFSHTGTICILILHLMGALDAPNLRPVWINTSNCGIARFILRADGFLRVLAINDTRHLSTDSNTTGPLGI